VSDKLARVWAETATYSFVSGFGGCFENPIVCNYRQSQMGFAPTLTAVIAEGTHFSCHL
jgi:hypothetical protein